jgi:hypothetical protein
MSAAGRLRPTSIQSIFRELAHHDPGISGGFIWNSSGIFASRFTPKEYAHAIRAGLGG